MIFVESGLADAMIRGAIFSAAALLWVLLLSRVVGLRSFSKMTAFRVTCPSSAPARPTPGSSRR